jgi:ribosomal-protein-alanine N-acetyltransferase
MQNKPVLPRARRHCRQTQSQPLPHGVFRRHAEQGPIRMVHDFHQSGPLTFMQRCGKRKRRRLPQRAGRAELAQGRLLAQGSLRFIPQFPRSPCDTGTHRSLFRSAADFFIWGVGDHLSSFANMSYRAYTQCRQNYYFNYMPMQPDTYHHSIVMLKAKDAAGLAALEAECFSTSWSEERYAALLSAAHDAASGGPDALPSFCAFGLRAGKRGLDAYISLGLHHAAGEMEIYNIAVRETRRQRGYGRRLLVHALREAALSGCTRALLEVRAGNSAALALYTRLGFRECGRRKRYYADTGEDALVLCRDLP